MGSFPEIRFFNGGWGGWGGWVTLCYTQGMYQIGKLTSTPCFTKSAFFRVSGERGGRNNATKYCIDGLSYT